MIDNKGVAYRASDCAFSPGAVYYATERAVDPRQMLVVCLGREGSRIQFAAVKALFCGQAEIMHGRESVALRNRYGDWWISAGAQAGAGDAAMIIELIEREGIA